MNPLNVEEQEKLRGQLKDCEKAGRQHEGSPIYGQVIGGLLEPFVKGLGGRVPLEHRQEFIDLTLAALDGMARDGLTPDILNLFLNELASGSRDEVAAILSEYRTREGCRQFWTADCLDLDKCGFELDYHIIEPNIVKRNSPELKLTLR